VIFWCNKVLLHLARATRPTLGLSQPSRGGGAWRRAGGGGRIRGSGAIGGGRGGGSAMSGRWGAPEDKGEVTGGGGYNGGGGLWSDTWHMHALQETEHFWWLRIFSVVYLGRRKYSHFWRLTLGCRKFSHESPKVKSFSAVFPLGRQK
jgi:hypothetical protein